MVFVRLQSGKRSHRSQLFSFRLCLSDLKIKVGDQNISAHKFVLAARSEVWSLANLASTKELNLSGEETLSFALHH